MKARSIRRCMAHLLFAELVPELLEIGLLPFKDFAKLLNALLHLARGAFAGFENERRGAAQIKRHKRLEQVFAIQFARMPRSGKFVDEMDPKAIGEMKIVTRGCAIRQSGEGSVRKKRLINVAKIRDGLDEAFHHALDVDGDGFDAHVKWEAKHRHRFGTIGVLPDALISLQQGKQRPYDLQKHAGQVSAGVFGVVELGAEVRLADAKAFGNRRDGHPDVHAETRNVRVPDVFFKVAGRQPAGKAKVASNGLTDALAEQRPGQGVNNP